MKADRNSTGAARAASPAPTRSMPTTDVVDEVETSYEILALINAARRFLEDVMEESNERGYSSILDNAITADRLLGQATGRLDNFQLGFCAGQTAATVTAS